MGVDITIAFLPRLKTGPLPLKSLKKLTKKWITNVSTLYVWERGEPAQFSHFERPETCYSGEKRILAALKDAYKNRRGVRFEVYWDLSIYSFPHAVTITSSNSFDYDDDYEPFVWGKCHYFAVVAGRRLRLEDINIEFLDTLREFWGAFEPFTIHVG